jgi:hypothetical protein
MHPTAIGNELLLSTLETPPPIPGNQPMPYSAPMRATTPMPGMISRILSRTLISRQNHLKYASLTCHLRTSDAESGAGPIPNGIRGLDHPKAYVSWSKHSHFDDRNTRWTDPISQSTDKAFRSQDWWRFVSIGKFLFRSLLSHSSLK